MTNIIGITERGDAGIDLSWEEKLPTVAFAILITKNLNDKFLEAVMRHKNQIILHAGITGMGGTVYEPNLPTLQKSYEQLQKLIAMGFPKEQIVLRVDPIIPTPELLKYTENVLNMFKDSGIKRVRVSVMDMYPHVKARFQEANVNIPYETFFAPIHMMNEVKYLLMKYSSIYEFETCAENIQREWRRACVSKKDAKILGVDILFYGSSNQRTGCLCPQNKHELLDSPYRCAHKCLYCFWKDKE